MIRIVIDWADPEFQWIDVDDPSPDDFADVARKFQLHQTSIQDCLDPEHHPKYEMIDATHFFIIRCYDKSCSFSSDSIEELTRKIAIFVQHGRMLTVHRAENADLNKLADKWRNALPTKDLPTWNLVNEVMRAALRTYDAPLEEIDREIGRIETGFFSNQKNPAQTPLDLEKIHIMKRKLGIFRRNFRLTMDALSRLGLSDKSKIPFIQDLREESESYYYYSADLIESLSNLATVEISLASHETTLASHETNEVIRFLTIYSIFFMPLNLIVGFYGMNLKWLPGAEQENSVYTMLAIMLASSLLIYVWFSKLGWIRRNKK